MIVCVYLVEEEGELSHHVCSQLRLLERPSEGEREREREGGGGLQEKRWEEVLCSAVVIAITETGLKKKKRRKKKSPPTPPPSCVCSKPIGVGSERAKEREGERERENVCTRANVKQD